MHPFISFVVQFLEAATPEKSASIDKERLQRYFSFFALQQCLAAQSSRITGIDASLGILVLVQISILVYVAGEAVSSGSLYLYVISVLLLVVTSIALAALGLVYGTESPEGARFLAGMNKDVDATIDQALVAMATDFESNRLKIRTKGRVLRVCLLLTVILTVAIAAARLH